MSKRHVPLLVLFVLVLVGAVQLQAANYPSGNPRTTDNDDSCDIALLPAATLLLPYFEVDTVSSSGETTLITITNTSNAEQAVHIVLWTDWGYPVIDFNIYLTGYDVQSINLYDVIALGQIAPTRGTGFDDGGSPVGDLSKDNPRVDQETCRSLTMQVPDIYRQRMQEAFINGRVPVLGNLPACNAAGSPRASRPNGHAIGYATIDVVSSCAPGTPEDQDYYDRLLFDNVLVGDYQQVNPSGRHAQSSPLVHIRAIPEGGTAGSRPATNLKRTFYSRHQSGAVTNRDARQPLPATFGARWIEGGSGHFQTQFKIWREGATGPGATCATYQTTSRMQATELVRFDEEENFTVLAPVESDVNVNAFAELPATALVDIADDDIFPPNSLGAVAGWVYANLDSPGGERAFARQGWIVASLRAEGRYSGDADAIALGNGCSPRIGESEAAAFPRTAVIGPAPNPNP
jgi:hypothetical protein